MSTFQSSDFTLRRFLLSQAPHSGGNVSCMNPIPNNLGSVVSAGHHGEGPHDVFNHLYFLMIYIALIWFFGKIALRFGMPALVGEIICGLVFGPHGLKFVSSSSSLIAVGEVGLIMLVVEAGLDVDIGMLKLIGPRGLAVAVFGSMFPLCLGTGMALTLGEEFRSAVAIGACFAPTSMGIALNVLKAGKILSTPTGQLIIAAAILDDVIALMLLSELEAMKNPTIIGFLKPLIISPVLIIVIGLFAIFLSPKLIKCIMDRVNKKYHENLILLLLFLATFGCVPGCYFAGSSYLLGAFLAGLMFCTDHTVHHAWKNQVKRLLGWMLRIFFSCTIGFAVPVNKFSSFKVIGQGLIYTCCIVGKLATGIFSRPITVKEFLTIAFSMSAWGEFAFILATASAQEGTISRESYASVLLAVLLSVILSPYALSFTVSFFQKKQGKQLSKNNQGNGNGHPVYYAIETRGRGGWGHQDKILHALYALNLEIIDFRAFHAPEFNHSVHKPLTKESFLLLDNSEMMRMRPTRFISEPEQKKLCLRVNSIFVELKKNLGKEAQISIKRWLPGVKKEEDTKVELAVCVKGVHSKKVESMATLKRRRVSYCRREAFKQANHIMSLSDLNVSLDEKEFLASARSAQLNGNRRSSQSPPPVINIKTHLNDPKFAGNTQNVANPYDSYDKIEVMYGNEDLDHHLLTKLTTAQDFEDFVERVERDHTMVSNNNNNNNNNSSSSIKRGDGENKTVGYTALDSLSPKTVGSPSSLQSDNPSARLEVLAEQIELNKIVDTPVQCVSEIMEDLEEKYNGDQLRIGFKTLFSVLSAFRFDSEERFSVDGDEYFELQRNEGFGEILVQLGFVKNEKEAKYVFDRSQMDEELERSLDEIVKMCYLRSRASQ